MQINTYRPEAVLEPFIRSYIYIEFENFDQRWWLPADTRNQLFIVFDGAPKVETGGQTYVHDQLALRGAFNQPVAVSFESKATRALVIEFTEIGILHLLGVEGKVIKNAFTPLKNVLDENIYKFFQNLRDQELFDKHIVDNLNRYFSEKKPTVTEGESNFIKALKRIYQTSGGVKIKPLADHVSVSDKTLLRYFKKYTGFSTKEYINIVRFQHACIKLLKRELTPKEKLDSIRGFYDQAHLINDFQKYAGTSPGKLDQLDSGWVNFLLQNNIY